MPNTTIYKYEVDHFMDLPEGFKVLSVQWQKKQLVMWALVNPEAPKITVEIYEMETGQPLSDIERFTYQGTFQSAGDHVFHLYLRNV